MPSETKLSLAHLSAGKREVLLDFRLCDVVLLLTLC